MRRARRVLLLLGNYYLENHRGIARHAREAHWILDTSYMRTGIVDASAGKVDGIVGLITRPRELEALKQFKNVPVVDLSAAWGTEALADQDGLQVPRVLYDNTAIGRRAAQHFIVRGFNHIALFNHGNYWSERERRTAFEAEIRQAGRVVYEIEYHRWVAEASQGNASGVEGRLSRRLGQALQKLPKPLGIFCPSDEIGARVLQACEDVGLRVPEEVAVLGCHNDELTCNFTLVPLSSVDDDLELQGYEAARLLERLMNGEKAPKAPILIPPKGIVTRASTDILAIPHREVATALRFIWQHYAEPIQTNDVAAAAGMSRHHLMRLFQTHLGRSISDEILRKRVEHAKRLLVETDLKAWQIAQASGFSSIVHLSSAFSRQVGQAPSRYRSQHQGNPHAIPS
ncbi:MAG TPA: DNA-binding transcriptional regulator [Luteolibacter sp.]